MAWQLGMRVIKRMGAARVAIQPTGLWLNRRAKEEIQAEKKNYVLVYWDARAHKLGLWFFSDPVKAEAPEHVYKVTMGHTGGVARISCVKLINEWGLYEMAKGVGSVSFALYPEGERGADFWVAHIAKAKIGGQKVGSKERDN